jgi:hypothetical protein
MPEENRNEVSSTLASALICLPALRPLCPHGSD